MKQVQLSDARKTLSSVIDDANRGVPSLITRRGRPEAVVVGFEEWQKLTRPSFAEFLLSAPFEPGNIPERDRRPSREVDLG